MFDEQPDGDPHGECAAEIHRLQKEHDALRAVLVAFKNATPTGFAGWHDKYAGAIKLAERVLTGLKDGPPPDWLDALPVVAHGFMGERDGKSVGYQVFAGDGPDTQDKLVKLSDVRAALGVTLPLTDDRISNHEQPLRPDNAPARDGGDDRASHRSGELRHGATEPDGAVGMVDGRQCAARAHDASGPAALPAGADASRAALDPPETRTATADRGGAAVPASGVGVPRAAQPLPGLQTLQNVIECLRADARYVDEEGEATDRLQDLLDAVENWDVVAECLDEAGVPRTDDDGATYSLWGRVERYARTRGAGNAKLAPADAHGVAGTQGDQRG